MAKKNKTALRIADEYDLNTLERHVDPEKAKAFLAGDESKDEKLASAATNATTELQSAAQPQTLSVREPIRSKTWKSRTIRLSAETDNALTQAHHQQKIKEARGELVAGEPRDVQQIVDIGVRLVLKQLGYQVDADDTSTPSEIG